MRTEDQILTGIKAAICSDEIDHAAHDDTDKLRDRLSPGVTRAMIQAFSIEAGIAGDRKQAFLCQQALEYGESSRAWALCTKSIAEAKAQMPPTSATQVK